MNGLPTVETAKSCRQRVVIVRYYVRDIRLKVCFKNTISVIIVKSYFQNTVS